MSALRLGRLGRSKRAITSGEGCLDEARKASEVGLPIEFCELTLPRTANELRTDQVDHSQILEIRRGSKHAMCVRMHGLEKCIVSVLRSEADPSRHYIGITNDVRARLKWHNTGPSGHTVDHRPWLIAVVIEFPTEREAVRFERYLKSGAGRAFAKRHFAAASLIS